MEITVYPCFQFSRSVGSKATQSAVEQLGPEVWWERRLRRRLGQRGRRVGEASHPGPPKKTTTQQEKFDKALRLMKQAAKEMRQLVDEEDGENDDPDQWPLMEAAADNAEAMVSQIEAAQALGEKEDAPQHCSLCALGAAAAGYAPAAPTDAHLLGVHVVPCLSRGQRAPGTSV